MFRSDQVNTLPADRIVILQAAILLLFIIIFLRLWYFQVYKGDVYAQKAQANITRIQSIHAPRGLIRDRNGNILADNRPAYGLAMIRENSADVQATLQQVSDWTDVPTSKLSDRFEQGRDKVRSFEPLLLVPNLTFDQLAYIEARIHNWPDLNIITRPLRTYPYGAPFSHVLGYVAQANEKELRANPRLTLGDMIGKQGVEKTFEDILHGQKGRKHLQVNAQGRILHSSITQPPQPGSNLDLTLDCELQQFVWESLGDHAGAVVVMEPVTGKIRALVSKPGYDNNLFVRGLSMEKWEDLLHDPSHPLQNRLIQSAYPPGSVFKLAVAGCALARSEITTSTSFYCSGRYRLGNGLFRCWRRYGHGRLEMKEAIARSCDVYFYNLGEELGISKIHSFCTQAGFGQKTGIRLPNEQAGLIPSKEWKLRRFGQPWQGGESVITAIGQGYTTSTPLQVARFISALVNGGRLLQPLLQHDASPRVQNSLPLQDAHREFIRQAMIHTVEGKRGTARRLRLPGATIGAKTGTAQVVRLTKKHEDKETEEIPYKFRDHAWMAAFGQQGDASYVVVTLVEHGGHGSSAAGPIVKGIFEYLLDPEEAG
ncbi:penicillin-binding protein 2 [Desulfovermiculus halophilus]|uniref:penicillin-binding protein 2 n=1 Tax=Desulfovermiculus halophilus TaxID=339722 RepID=UPI000486984B|nr:penicillin-binding protein 2 [Desulfovermiculus halophilus]